MTMMFKRGLHKELLRCRRSHLISIFDGGQSSIAGLPRSTQSQSHQDRRHHYYSNVASSSCPLDRPQLCCSASFLLRNTIQDCATYNRMVRSITSTSGPMVEGEIVETQPPKSTPVPQEDTPNDDHTVLDIQLQTALNHHQSLLDNSSSTESELIQSLERLREIYEQLQYWEDAIATQEALLQEYHEYLLPKQQSDAYGRIGRYWLAQGSHKYWKTAQKYSQMSLDILLHKVYSSPPTNQTTPTNDPKNQKGRMVEDPLFHADIGRAYNDLATILSDIDLEQSFHYLEKAEDQYRYHGLRLSQTGREEEEEEEYSTNHIPPHHHIHPEISKILENQGLILRMMGNHEHALGKYREAMEVWETSSKAYGVGDDPDKGLKLQVSIADCYQSMEEIGLAQGEYERIMMEYYGKDNKEEEEEDKDDDATTTTADKSTSKPTNTSKIALEGVVKHNLGQIYSQQGKHEEALEYFLDAYHVKRKVAKMEHGDEAHPEVAKTLNGIGAVYATLGNTSEALSYFRESLLIARIHADADLGDNDPNILHALRNIAIVKGEKPPTFTAP